jgi:2-methylcitrate dehydratase PrpD
MPGLTENVASFIVNTRPSDVPETAIDKAKKVVTDTVGVILAGINSEVAPALLRYVAEAGVGGCIPILGTGLKSTGEIAALANGTLGHSLDFDDVLPIMPGHPSIVVVSALLSSFAPGNVTGQAFLDAYIFGVEVAAKIGAGMGSGHQNAGWHPTGTLGVLGAVAALARLQHLDMLTTRHAIGMACSMASGIQRNFGTMTKSFHAGWAAKNAITAVQLASKGFTAAPDALEAKSGFFALYGTDESSSERTMELLGRPFAVDDPGSSLKMYPCCYALHRAIDGLLDLRKQHGLTAANTESVLATVAPGSLKPLIYPRPETGLEGKFSMEYSLTVGILDGKFGFKAFSDEAVQRPEIKALYPRVKALEDPRVSPGDPLGKTKSAGSRGFVEVQISTKSGDTYTVEVQHPRGSPKKALTWSEVKEKFLDCAAYGQVDPERAGKAVEILSNLDTCQDGREFIGLLG